jgi:hemoglobin
LHHFASARNDGVTSEFLVAARRVTCDRSRVASTPFERIGGEPVVRALVDDFYDRMDAAPEAAEIRALHPPRLNSSRDKLFWFLCGWLGGPAHYVERFGHPRLRARHLPFPIDVAARDQWLGCMRPALEKHVGDPELRATLYDAMAQLADHMRNAPEPPAGDST